MDYTYEALNNQSKQIRLFSFSNSDKTSAKPLEIDISTFTLEDAPPYTALSYAWGEPDSPAHIFVNGGLFPDQPSCNYALQQLRSASWPSQHFWLDAICINQQNDAEKGPQVQMMARIFSKAAVVAISYGVDTDATAEFMLCVEAQAFVIQLRSSNSAANSVCFSHQLRRHQRISGEKRDLEGAKEAFNKDAAYFSALMDIGSRPYWSRLWVVQEVFSAKSAVVLHRHGYFPLQTLHHFTTGLAQDFLQLRSDVLPRWASCCRSLPMVKLLKDISDLAGGAEAADASARIPLFETLRRYGDRHCQEWRDRVYALVNIVTWPTAIKGLCIDYQISRADLAIAVLGCYSGCPDGDVLALAELLCKLLGVTSLHYEPEQYMGGRSMPFDSPRSKATTNEASSRHNSVSLTSAPRPLASSTCGVRLGAPGLYKLHKMDRDSARTLRNAYVSSHTHSFLRGLHVNPCRGRERPHNPTLHLPIPAHFDNATRQAGASKRLPVLPRESPRLPRPERLFCVHKGAPECAPAILGFICGAARAGDLVVELSMNHCFGAWDPEAHLVPNIVIRGDGETYALVGYALLFECSTSRRHRNIAGGGHIPLRLDPADA